MEKCFLSDIKRQNKVGVSTFGPGTFGSECSQASKFTSAVHTSVLACEVAMLFGRLREIRCAMLGGLQNANVQIQEL